MVLQGQIPEHRRVGRGNAPGPQLASYLCIPLAASLEMLNAADNTLLAAVQMPCDFRLESFEWHLPAVAAATAVLTVAHSATSVVGGTALLSATIDLEVATEGQARASGTTPTIVAAERNLVRGRWVVAELDGNNTGDIFRGTFLLYGFPYGHINADLVADD